ncbi:MAG TPA: GNAT family N-acetyltransferase [Thermoanaerobaculia bacterium]|jgi:RimJ/RimL family protein N-acetyltransferase
MNAPTLTTERLHLRMLQESDYEEYAAIHMDDEVTRFTARMHLDRLDSWKHLAMIVGHWQLRGFGMWGVFERETNRLAGRVGFYQPETWPDFELGWTIGKAFWGKGYAPEAAKACLDHAFQVMKKKRVISLIDPLNVASIRVAEKIGETLSDEQFDTGGHKLLVYEALSA